MPLSSTTALDTAETRAVLQEVIDRARNAFARASQLDRRPAQLDTWTSPLYLPGVDRAAAEILLRTDSASPSTGEASRWAVLVICGVQNVVTLLLPTKRVDQLDQATYDRWILLIQGRDLWRCGVSNNQRAMLLKITLVYRAFSSAEHPDVDPTDFDIFAGRLSTLAHTLGPYQRADCEIDELVDYLELTLPEDIFASSAAPAPYESDDAGDFEHVGDDDVIAVEHTDDVVQGDDYESDEGSMPSLRTYVSDSE